MLGDVLREARINAGLSQEQLAQKTNLHRTYISLIERNKRQPTIQVFIKICWKLGVTPSEIIKKIESSMR